MRQKIRQVFQLTLGETLGVDEQTKEHDRSRIDHALDGHNYSLVDVRTFTREAQ
jgi:hypothetical protein